MRLVVTICASKALLLPFNPRIRCHNRFCHCPKMGQKCFDLLTALLEIRKGCDPKIAKQTLKAGGKFPLYLH